MSKWNRSAGLGSERSGVLRPIKSQERERCTTLHHDTPCSLWCQELHHSTSEPVLILIGMPPKVTNRPFSDELPRLLKARGMTLRGLARDVGGVDHAYLSRM